MMYTHAYRVTHCPRYEEPDVDHDKVHENLLAQAALLNALRYLFVGRGRCRVELRFVVDPVYRRVSLFLLVAAPPEQRPDTSVLERLLPADYGWQRLPLQPGSRFPDPNRPPGTRWCSDIAPPF